MKRRKPDEIVGVLEFKGTTRESPEILQWLADHKSQSGGTVRLSQGATGCRVAFSKEADLARWKDRSATGSRS